MEDLSYECMEIISNAVQLISVLLEWTCSCFRIGPHRIYLATRLLRRWSHLDADIYEGIISYLQNRSWDESGQLDVVFRIVAELVRSKHFSAGRYLQWLIATGSLERDLQSGSVVDTILCIACANDLQVSSWPVRLITAFPLTGLSDQVRNLRSTLLRGTAHSADFEEQALNLAKCGISRAVPALFGLDVVASEQTVFRAGELSLTAKLELGIWLRQGVAQYADINEQ
jgi:mediator of RNA polymerase II transcription subunit 12